MTAGREPHAQPRGPMLTLRGGGWVLLLAGLITLGLATWALWKPLTRGNVTPVPLDVEAYGYDLSNLRIPRDELFAAIPVDALPPTWDYPELVPADAIGDQIRFGRDKYVVTTDRVIGVTVAGESRAYPLNLLNVHEVVNDTIAGVPIAVTYQPWCDSAVVFERTLAGETIELAASGLLIDSNQVLADRRDEPARSSLFRQLSGEAVAGPAAERGESLMILPASLTTWGDWHATHPDTGVIGWNELLIKRYEGSSPAPYFRSPKLAFPVDPLPPPNLLPLKARVMSVTAHGERRVYPLPFLAKQANADGIFADRIGELEVVIRYDRKYGVASLQSPPPVVGEDVSVVYAMWFAWFAAFGDADVVGLEAQAK